jgi:hypothetical protein
MFRAVLGEARVEFPATVLWLPDDEEKRQEAHGSLKWYDARERDPSRSAEFRLYYPVEAEPVVQLALPGDLLVLALMSNGSVLVVLAPNGSTSERQLLWLFGLPTGLDEPATKRLTETDEQLNAMATEVLQAIGVETQEDAPDFLDELLSRFGLTFPTTAEMSAFARDASPTSRRPATQMKLW